MSENKPVMSNEQPKESWLAGIILVAIVFALAKACNPDSTSTQDHSDDYYFACTAAEKEVKEELKSPSSAKFPVCSEMDITNTRNTWTIKSYVEAQNSFGAMIKTNFTVKIELLGNNKYSVIYVNVD
jgi:hypothetical protein